MYRLRTTSYEMGASRKPTAEPTPALRGTTIRSISSFSARRAAWIGAAPPNATSARPAIALPHSAAWVLAALAMFSSTTSPIARAAAAASIPSLAPTCPSRAAAAAPASSGIAPPAKRAGSSLPSVRSASVTVGRSPPIPYAAGPGSDPALAGPTRTRPKSSTSAMEPPPAPISTISITGTRTGRPLPFWKR